MPWELSNPASLNEEMPRYHLIPDPVLGEGDWPGSSYPGQAFDIPSSNPDPVPYQHAPAYSEPSSSNSDEDEWIGGAILFGVLFGVLYYFTGINPIEFFAIVVYILFGILGIVIDLLKVIAMEINNLQ